MTNGTTRRGKQNYKCRDCGRHFVENPPWRPIDPNAKATYACGGAKPSLENHIGAIWYFIHHYNEMIRPEVSPC